MMRVVKLDGLWDEGGNVSVCNSRGQTHPILKYYPYLPVFTNILPIYHSVYFFVKSFLIGYMAIGVYEIPVISRSWEQ